MFALFRFDLPIAVTEQLVAQLDQMRTSPLTDEELKKLSDYQIDLAKVQKLPKIQQGVYVIYLAGKAVYAGKADNLRIRLGQHKFKLSGRRNIDLAKTGFKCLLLEASWSTSANENLLIKHYQEKKQCDWNFVGFGINDPGKNRDGAIPNAFDTSFPINENWKIQNVNEQDTAAVLLSNLKDQLPFLLRYSLDDESGQTKVNLNGISRSAKEVVLKVAQTLGPKWQFMLFKGYMTLYPGLKKFQHGEQLYP